MTTLQNLADETLRRLLPSQLDLTGLLVTTLTATTGTFSLEGPMVSANTVSPGMVFSVGLEVMYVTSWSQATLQASVIRGYSGSTPAAHTAGALVHINPTFTLFDVVSAINEDLMDLSGPQRLYRVKTLTITYNPVFSGYNFPVDTGYYDVLGVRYKIAPPTHNYPPIKNWTVLPNMTDPTYPSGNTLVIYDAGWPGLPVHVWYATSFGTLTTLTQTVQSVTGLPITANDLPPIGASIRLVQTREVKRNFIEVQPDPRKAVEVPPAAVMNSIKALQQFRLDRIDVEKGRLDRKYATLRVR